MKVTGHITRHRCFGKTLAFADIQIQHIEDPVDDGNKDGKMEEESCRPQQEEIIQVVFHRRAQDDNGDASSSTDFVWEEDLPGNKFPQRITKLP